MCSRKAVATLGLVPYKNAVLGRERGMIVNVNRTTIGRKPVRQGQIAKGDGGTVSDEEEPRSGR